MFTLKQLRLFSAAWDLARYLSIDDRFLSGVGGFGAGAEAIRSGERQKLGAVIQVDCVFFLLLNDVKL